MKILLLNQTFYPDVVSTAQHLSDLAVALARRGHEVTVVAGCRAYDDPGKLFPKDEVWEGIRICRVGSTRFGKGAKWRRAADFASFLFNCCWKLLWLPRQDAVVALTSPPLISFIGVLFARVRHARFFYWVMDLNPDEAIAAHWLREGTFLTRILQWMSRFSLRQAEKVIALDEFMEARIAAKGIAREKIAVLPPWSHDDAVDFDAKGRAAFRQKHGLADKFVVMYSGNHSPCHPLDTLLETAKVLASEDRFQFLFVGGGSGFAEVKDFAARNQLGNILCLPYQPLSELAGSLSSADLQVVVMGDPFVGIIHPSKIYNIMAVAAPILYIGPEQSHAGRILAKAPAQAWGRVAHGDVAGCAATIRRISAADLPRDAGMFKGLAAEFSAGVLLPKLISVIETADPAARQ